MKKAVELEITDHGIGLLTMNRPESLNAFNGELCTGLLEGLKQVENENKVKVIILTGQGTAFSSGGDVRVLDSIDSPATAKWACDSSLAVVKAVYDSKKPVIAEVNGVVGGAALALMMACDLIVASDAARFAFSFINIALTPDCGFHIFNQQSRLP